MEKPSFDHLKKYIVQVVEHVQSTFTYSYKRDLRPANWDKVLLESEHLIKVIFWGEKNKQISLSIYIIIIRNWYSTNHFNLEGMPLTDFQETGKKRATKFGGFRNGDDVKGQSTRHMRVKGTECRSHVPPTVKRRCPIPNTCKPLQQTVILDILTTTPHPLRGPYPYPQIIHWQTEVTIRIERSEKYQVVKIVTF